MSSSDLAFGRMLRQLVDLSVLCLETDPLNTAIVRRLEQFSESINQQNLIFCDSLVNIIYHWMPGDDWQQLTNEEIDVRIVDAAELPY